MELTDENIPKTCNVKGHFKINKSACEKICDILKSSDLAFDIKNFHNFMVLRFPDQSYIYTLFTTSGHVNVTGIKSFDLVKDSADFFAKTFDLVLDSDCVKVDNSTSTGRIIGGRLNLLSVKSKLEDKCSNTSFILRPHFFPGGVIRRKKLPTVILFASGKYIIVGSKSEEESIKTYTSICVNIR